MKKQLWVGKIDYNNPIYLIINGLINLLGQYFINCSYSKFCYYAIYVLKTSRGKICVTWWSNYLFNSIWPFRYYNENFHNCIKISKVGNLKFLPKKFLESTTVVPQRQKNYIAAKS